MTIADDTPQASPGRDIARTSLIRLVTLGTAAKRLTVTEHEFGDETVIANVANPCTGGVPETLTEVGNGVFHLTGFGLDPAEPGGVAGDTSTLEYITLSHDTDQERT